MTAKLFRNESLPPGAPDGQGDALDPLLEQALEWMVTLHSGIATVEDRSAYEAWTAQSSECRGAAGEAERLWRAIGPAARPASPTLRGKALLGAILAAGLLGGLFAGGVLESPSALLADQHTTIGERRSLTLADGSRLDMDANTTVDIEISDNHRRVVLHGGRIHVSVRPDPRRPFDVQAAGGVIRALGTAFDVLRRDEQVRVTVTEHAVAVSYASHGQTGEVRVAAGQEVGFDAGQGLGRPVDAPIREAMAWRRGQVIFDGRSLGDVLRETERYRTGIVIVTNAGLRDLPVTGVFETDDTEGMLSAIADALPVQVYRLPWITLIRPKSATSRG